MIIILLLIMIKWNKSIQLILQINKNNLIEFKINNK